MKKRIVYFIIAGGAAVLGASPQLLKFMERWEGFEYVVYADKIAGGLPTVCSGITKHTSPYPVILGERWSKEKCESATQKIVLEIQGELAKCVTQNVDQSVWDSLSDHGWHFGVRRTCNSQTVSEINKGNIKKGCDLLAYKPSGEPNWSYAGNTFYQGLHNRAKARRDLCLKDLQ